MRDPIQTLTSLDPGADMQPLPAAEVRRRGDAMRRRRVATIVAGASLAVAAIAVPVALLSTDGPTPIEPATTSAAPTTTWRTEIPAGFDIDPATEFMDPVPLTISEGAIGASTIELCGTPSFPMDGVVDRLAGDAETGESADFFGRELRLYADDAPAQAALERVRDAVAGCPQEVQGTTTWIHVGDDTRLSVIGDDATTVIRTYEVDGQSALGTDTWNLIRVGNAVLAWYSYEEHRDPTAEDLSERVDAQTEAIVEQMCVFSLEGC